MASLESGLASDQLMTEIGKILKVFRKAFKNGVMKSKSWHNKSRNCFGKNEIQ